MEDAAPELPESREGRHSQPDHEMFVLKAIVIRIKGIEFVDGPRPVRGLRETVEEGIVGRVAILHVVRRPRDSRLQDTDCPQSLIVEVVQLKRVIEKTVGDNAARRYREDLLLLCVIVGSERFAGRVQVGRVGAVKLIVIVRAGVES